MDSLTLSTRLERLRRIHPRLRVQALWSSVAGASPHELGAIGVELLELAAEGADSNDSWRARAKRYWGKLIGSKADRVRDLALAGVIGAYGSLSAEAREAALASGAGRWGGVLERVPGKGSDRVRAGVARLAAESLDPAVLGIVREMLREAEGPVASAADRAFALVGYALGVADDGSGWSPPAELEAERVFPGFTASRWGGVSREDEEAIGRLVAESASEFGLHHKRGPVMAAMYMLGPRRSRDRSGALGAWLHDPRQPGHAALRGVLRWSALAVARERAWEWLPLGHLEVAAGDRLSRGRSVEEHERVLERGYLALRPARGRRLASIALAPAKGSAATVGPTRTGTKPVRESMLPATESLASLTPDARRWIPMVAGMLKGESASRIVATEALLADEDPIVRHALARWSPQRLVQDACFDADARVARSAFVAWSEGGTLAHEGVIALTDAERERMTRALARSPHEAVRSWARDELERVAGVWGHDGIGGGIGLRLRWRRWVQGDPEGALGSLRTRLAEGSAEERHGALMLVRELGLAGRLWEPIAAIAGTEVEPGGAPARASATAVASLATVPGPAIDRAIEAGARSPDARVRANAADAMARRVRVGLAGSPGVGRIAELKLDPHHRVRASVLRTLALEGSIVEPREGGTIATSATEDLVSMLADARAEHRVAALWALERVMPGRGRAALGPRWAELLARVVEVARLDREDRVRRRALRCAWRLERDVRGTRLEPVGAGGVA